MAFAIVYDDSNLRGLFAQLDKRQRAKAIRGAVRREASRVRKAAVGNLRGSGISSNRDLERGVRSVVYKKRIIGFRVTVGTKKAGRNGKGESGMHTNRRGLKKPVLIWAEDGTSRRRTKSKAGGFGRSRGGHSTGSMRRYGFIDATRSQVSSTVADNLASEMTRSIIETAKKYGCK